VSATPSEIYGPGKESRTMTGNRRRGRGEGSIVKRSDGRWEARVDLGYVDGKRKQKSLYARTRKEVAERLRTAQQAFTDGSLMADERMTVGRWLEHWVKNVLANRVANGNLTQSTFYCYSTTVRLHLEPGLGRYRLGKLTPAHVDAFISSKRERYSPNSLRIMRSTLRKALRDAQKSGNVHRNAAELSEPVNVTCRVKAWLDAEQARQLLVAMVGDRLEALYIVMLSLGLRRGEALGLRWEDIDLDRATVLIRRSLKRVPNVPSSDGTYPDGRKTRLVFGAPKTEDSWRTQNLPAPCVSALRSHKSRQAAERLAASYWGDEGLVFTTPIGTPIDPDNLAKRFVALCKRAGLGHRNLHQLRHSAATIMLAQGVELHEVKDVLGHSSLAITKDVYGHLVAARRRAAADAVGEALWGERPVS
jgi:integrase